MVRWNRNLTLGRLAQSGFRAVASSNGDFSQRCELKNWVNSGKPKSQKDKAIPSEAQNTFCERVETTGEVQSS